MGIVYSDRYGPYFKRAALRDRSDPFRVTSLAIRPGGKLGDIEMSGENTSSTDRVQHMSLEFRNYEQTSAKINRLSMKLPEDVVINLAREVIRRVAARDALVASVETAPSQAELRTLWTALLSPDDAAAARMVLNLRTDGTAVEVIHLKYLAGAARLLGEQWEQNEIGFAEVTLGTGRMFAIMRGMRHLFEPAYMLDNKSAVFASVPGEDHTMGVRMAADLFRKEGWEISLKVGLDHDALVAEIEEQPTAIVGLSIGGEHSMEPLSKLIVALHICCPQALILICGQDVEKARPMLELFGVDGIAETVEEAKDQMERLWELKMGRPRQVSSC